MDVEWITSFVDRGPDGFGSTVDFWSAITGSLPSPWRGSDDEFATLLPTDGSDAHLRLQRTRSGSSGSHIDLHVADVGAQLDACVGHGATVIADDGDYVVLATPGAMTFCVVAHHGEQVRQRPVALGVGEATTLVDQVSIDCDPEHFDREVQFWSELTGWAPLAARAPEFVPLDRPPAMPLRVMVQRRSHASGPTTCHLDLACSDVEATISAHKKLGATVVGTHRYWTVMLDPSGGGYCLTRREPTTGNLSPEA